MFEIKANPKMPYHYIIGVAVKSAVEKSYGELYLKYFLEFQHEDIERLRTALRLIKDRMFPSGIKKEEAIHIAGCEEILWSFAGMKIAAAKNQASLHHFSSPCKIDDKFFEDLVRSANTSDHNKKLLENSRI